MKLLSVTFLILILPTFLINAQTPPVKYGEITRADLESEPYSQEKGSEAVVLSEYATSKIILTNAFKVQYTYQVRIKILKAAGYRYANVEIPYYSDYQFSNLKACTHNLENGEVNTIHLSRKQFIREEVNPYKKAIRFTLPQVRQGSIIEYSYQVDRPTIFAYVPFVFQWDIPVRHVEYWAFLPRFFLYNINFHGYDLIMAEHNEQQGYFDGQPHIVDIYKYSGNMVPAFEGEPKMPEGSICYAGVDFSLARVDFPGLHTEDVAISYPKLSAQLLDNADLMGAFDNTLLFTKTVREITGGKTSEIEKLQAIYTFVQQSFMWDGYDQLLPEDHFLKVFREKSGSSAELNLLLLNLIRTAGIQADPVVLSTRDNGPINTLVAMADNLNYMICLAEVNGKEYLLDVTNKYMPMGSLPFKCQNVQGWVLSKSRGRWIPLLTHESYATQELYTLSYHENGDLTGTCKASFSGYDAINYRRFIHNEGVAGFQYKIMATPGLNFTISNLKIESLDNLDEALIVTFDIVIHNAFHSGAEIAFFKPLVSIFGDYEKTWVKDTRQFAIDLGCPTRNNFTCTIDFPVGTRFEELPPGIKIALPKDDASFQYMTTQEGRRLSMKCDLKINKTIFETNEYPSFREFYTQVNRKINEVVILKGNQAN